VLIAPPTGGHSKAGGPAAAVVLLGHGLGVDVGWFAVRCRRELADAVAVLAADALAVELCWPVSAALAMCAAPTVPVPVADVPAGFGVALVLDDGLGVGVGVGDPVGVVDPLGVGDPLGTELGGAL